MGRLVRRSRTTQGADEPDLASDQALRAAYRAHGPELYRFALRQLRDDGGAQDVVQEVFLRAWRSADRFDPNIASLRVWLFAIARHVVVDEIRRSGARPARAFGLAMEETSGAKGIADNGFDEQKMTAWLIEEALSRISPEHRTALVETYFRGRPHAEVAAEQGVPTGTLRSRLFYGLKSLRVVMEEMGVEP
ncbi:sigma-70 family RNA polymerase sigma factor [Actinokineospora xionganensis]|uniref:Sigma-70 family RNA polymerase sigma factor n=1 Tax=Actinokineospora xionganensis TaxID=2684470 RepID=A0ABR7L4W9_9PSEU|nr:sigma-70 family RNA polymerase sigma factor [Actinokineospora xionganensis]MBC6447627.1 sigma-70 family RNA polymerase sigma factor [Actinokineospora xionganensis]